MRITASMLVVVLSFGGSQSAPRGFRWWLDPHVQRDLTLTAGQVTALDAEYARTLEQRRRLRREFDIADAELATALMRGELSDVAAEVLVDRVEQLRRQRNVARKQLLVAMYFILTKEQRAKFPDLLASTIERQTR